MTEIFKVQEIGEKIFNFLEEDDWLNCRLVCKTWKLVLEEPIFWLDKLKSIGHPEAAHEQWLDLIHKSFQTGKPKQNLSLSLMLKFYSIPILLGPSNSLHRKACLNFPPIHTAAKYGQLEVVKLIHQFDRDCNRPISFWPANPNQSQTPLMLAMKHHHNTVAKYILENVEVCICTFIHHTGTEF